MEKRETRILRAAEDLFYERGFHGVSVDEIGARAKSTGPAIYRSFSGKEELLVTLFDEALDELSARREAPANGNDDLDALVDVHVGFLLEHHKLASVWIREDRGLPKSLARNYHRRSREYIDRWVVALEEEYPKRSREEILTATYAALGTVNSVATWRRQAGKMKSAHEFLAGYVKRGLEASLGDAATAAA